MPAVCVSPFTEADIDDALVLAGLGALEVTPEQWRAFADRPASGPDRPCRGLVARDERGRLSGILLYEISRRAYRQGCLQVEHLICFDLFEPSAIADALIAELLRLAALEGWDHLSLVRPMPGAEAAAALVRASDATALLRVF